MLLPPDIKKYFQDIHAEYVANTQTDTEGGLRKQLVAQCSKSAFSVSFVLILLNEKCVIIFLF